MSEIEEMYVITSTPMYRSHLGAESVIFRGRLEDILFKYGGKSSNSLRVFKSRGIYYIIKFYKKNGQAWREIDDPRPDR